MANNVYDEFRREFDRMPRDEQVQLGMAGLIQMYSGDNTAKSRMSRPMSSRGSGRDEGVSVSGIGDTVRVHVEGMDDRAMDTLVSKMRKQTYNVRIASVFNDIIDPIAHNMNVNMIKNQIFRNRIQYENVLYYRGIIEAVNNLGGTNKENFFEATARTYQNFMRHPIWNSMRLLTSTFIKPMFNLARGVLFGFKKKESDTDRIVRAIEEQTEFMRTGRIERETNMFQRLFRSGVVPSLVRGVTGFLTADSVSIDAAKQGREKVAEGYSMTLMEKLSNRLFGKYVDVRGQDWKEKEQANFRDLTIEYQNKNIETLQSILETNAAGFTRLNQALNSSMHMRSGLAATGTDGIAPNAPRSRNHMQLVQQNSENLENIAESTKKNEETTHDIYRMQANERIMHWLRSGLTIASNTVTTIGASIAQALTAGSVSGALSSIIARGFSTGIGRYFIRGAIPVALMWAGLEFKDWILDKLGLGGDRPNTRQFLGATERANNNSDIQSMDREIGALEAEKQALVSSPDYQVNPDKKRRALQLDRQIAQKKSARQRMFRELVNNNMSGNSSVVSSQLASFIRSKEGFLPTSERDGKDQFGNQLYSIGYGNQFIDGRRVGPGETITRRQADELMLADVARRRQLLEEGLQGTGLAPHQLDALTSLAYNVKGGVSTVLGSTLVQKIRNGDMQGAADEFLRWNKAGGEVLPGLTTRRREERDMFLGNFSPAASGLGPRLSDGAKAAAYSVAGGAQGDGWGAVVAQKLDQVVNGIRELINSNEGTGSNADAFSLSNLLGR